MSALPIEKFSNALLPGALPAPLIGGGVRSVLERFGRKHGGLWVGGKVVITADGLSFAPNRLNAALHDGLESVRIPMSQIRSVRREFGWLSGIVVVEHHLGEFRFRCFGAKRIASVLSSRIALRP